MEEQKTYFTDEFGTIVLLNKIRVKLFDENKNEKTFPYQDYGNYCIDAFPDSYKKVSNSNFLAIRFIQMNMEKFKISSYSINDPSLLISRKFKNQPFGFFVFDCIPFLDICISGKFFIQFKGHNTLLEAFFSYNPSNHLYHNMKIKIDDNFLKIKKEMKRDSIFFVFEE